MDKFADKYRIPSARAPWWNYGQDAAYFVTICTHNRQCYFGKVINNKMDLSQIGAIADVLWYEIKNHAKNVELDEFVVMPNHIHGILILNGNTSTKTDISNISNVETTHALSLHDKSDEHEPDKTDNSGKTKKFHYRFRNPGKNTLSSILGSYKSAVTKHAYRLGFKFDWQSRFHDHIIRDEQEYQRIANYIIHNPENWNNDKFYDQ